MVGSSFYKVQVSGTNATDQDYIANCTGARVGVASLTIVPNVSVSVDASNFITLSVKKGATTIATHTTNSSGGAAMTAGTPIAMSITGTGKDVEVADGSVLSVEVAKSGTGPTYDFAVVARLEQKRATS
jgi:hypothetical protein